MIWTNRLRYQPVALGGRVLIVLAIGPKVPGFKTGREQWIFKGDKNTQHAFLRRGSKAFGPMSQDFTACKNYLQIKIFHTAKFIIPFTRSFCLLPDD
jgi:hypothetical protein